MTEQKHSLLSPSSAHRWMVCTGSVDLCKDIPRETNEAAERGTAFHELAHEYLTVKLPNCALPEALIDNAPGEIREYLRYVWALRDKGTNYYERKVSIPCPDYQNHLQVFGTADCIHLGEGILEIIDLKTGSLLVAAKENLQLLLYALMAHNELCCKPGLHIYKIKMTIIQHQVIDSWEINSDFFLGFLDDVITAQDNIYLGNTEYVLGDHCQYCPAKSLCPKYIQDLKVLDYEFKGIQHLTLDEMQRILLVRKKLDAYLDSVHKELEKKLKEGVTLEDFELRPKRGKRVYTKGIAELEADVMKKDNWKEYFELKSLTAIEKFDKVFVDENTSYVAGELGLAIKKVEAAEFEFKALESA